MDILSIVIISGMATSYLIGIVSEVPYFSSRVVRILLTLPLSILFTWFLGLTEFELAVGSLAAGFFSAAVLLILSRPVTVTNLTNRR